MATSIATALIISVAFSSGRTPNSPNWGSHLVEVRNSPSVTLSAW